MVIEPIAHICNDLPEKFGVPRQSGLVPELSGTIVFCPAYRNPDALRGLEDFSHIWLLWDFSQCHKNPADDDPSSSVGSGGHFSHDVDDENKVGDIGLVGCGDDRKIATSLYGANGGKSSSSVLWQPTVRPPRLGGNVRMGVFATRSPFRPNNIGLSSVKIAGIDLNTPHGPVIHVLGADLMNGTPIYDIKPYIRFTDSHPDAASGFVDSVEKPVLEVNFPNELLSRIPIEKQSAVLHLLSQDPRPAYQNDPLKVYGLSFACYDIRFRVSNGLLEVVDILQL